MPNISTESIRGRAARTPVQVWFLLCALIGMSYWHVAWLVARKIDLAGLHWEKRVASESWRYMLTDSLKVVEWVHLPCDLEEQLLFVYFKPACLQLSPSSP